MTSDEKFVASRLKDLSKRSFDRGIWTFSDFLTLSEQSLVSASTVGEYELYGGYDGAERRIAVFGSVNICGYVCDLPLKVLGISPVSAKFAEVLTHRDFLGALMSLGVKRDVLGDIIVRDNVGYVICLDTITGFIKDNLIQIKHTPVHCEILDELPEGSIQTPETREILVSSERIDAVVSAVYNLSRSDSKELFGEKKIFINSRCAENSSLILKSDSIVSVRGRGRFKYNGIIRTTKKGRIAVSIEVY